MFNVIICEDNKKQRELIENTINGAIARNLLEGQIILSTNNPKEVIEYVDKVEKAKIYYLDISLNSEMDGLELAKIIRKKDINGYIIFVTTHSELTLLTFEYKIEALDYIIKDDISAMNKRIVECLEKANENLKISRAESRNFISVTTGGKINKINFDEILFFETSDKVHKVIIHTCNKQIEFYSSIREIEKVVNQDFYRCHRSYIVNKKNIKKIDKAEMIAYMINDEKCYISGKYFKGLIDK